MPVLIFDKEGNSELLKWKETDSRLIAKMFPFRKLIMGRNALCRMIDSSIYNGPEFSFNGIIGKIVFVFLAIIMVLAYTNAPGICSRLPNSLSACTEKILQ